MKAERKGGDGVDNEQIWIEKLKKKQRSKEADRLISKYYDEIYVYSFKQVLDKELAMDLTQEIFISMLRSISLYDSEKSAFRTWLYRIASNKIIDYRRSRRGRELLSFDAESFDVPDEPDFERTLENSELIAKIEEYVSSFDAGNQEIFRLRVFGEYSFREIAECISIPEASIKTSYYRMIKKIRKEFEDEYTDAFRS
ncbi:MAG: sigma-70 family RNA polymerase sigma factor [Clostridia bacterium]|nr:sigma-70 family RNA polymerase sigma factor [Clostridia bacterium]